MVSDEQDEELYAAWDEEEAFALSELRRILGELPEPERPSGGARRAAATRLREMLARPGYPGNVLRACAGFDGRPLPDDDEDLWLTVAAGIAGPISDLPEEEDAAEGSSTWTASSATRTPMLAALCAIHHADWLAVVAALARRGPGVLASPERIARLIAESEDIDIDAGRAGGPGGDGDAVHGSVTPLWAHLGIVDTDRGAHPAGPVGPAQGPGAGLVVDADVLDDSTGRAEVAARSAWAVRPPEGRGRCAVRPTRASAADHASSSTRSR